MGTLFVDRHGLELRFSSGALELRHAGSLVQTVPSSLLERVVVRSDTMISSSALASMAHVGIGLSIISGRTGDRTASILGAPSKDVVARIGQALALKNEELAVAWCRQLVKLKLKNQRRLLVKIAEHRQDIRKVLIDSQATLARVIQQTEEVQSRASLRGLEGAGAAAFFRAYTSSFAPALGFIKRQRRPPPDPVNACLSLGYTLLIGEAVKVCWQTGLDPMIGLYHSPAHGRPAMACDLIEPWRSRIDQWVWSLFRDKHLRSEHFGSDRARACLLGKTGRAVFYQEWADISPDLNRGLRRHARLVVERLREQNPELTKWVNDDMEFSE